VQQLKFFNKFKENLISIFPDGIVSKENRLTISCHHQQLHSLARYRLPNPIQTLPETLLFFPAISHRKKPKKKKETAQVGDSRPGLLQRVVSRLLHCEPSLDPPVASLHEVHLHMQDLLMLPPAITHVVLGTSTQQAKNP
jgi:hypothetical protein